MDINIFGITCIQTEAHHVQGDIWVRHLILKKGENVELDIACYGTEKDLRKEVTCLKKESGTTQQ